MKKSIYGIGIFLSIASCIYFLLYFQKHFSDLPSIEKGLSTYLNFGFAIILSSIPIALGGIGWHLLLRAVNESSSLRDSIVNYTISQFGKFFPGNFGHHIGRISLSISTGLSFPSVIFAMALEFYLSLISGLALATSTYLISIKNCNLILPSISKYFFGFMPILLLLPIFVFSFMLLLNKKFSRFIKSRFFTNFCSIHNKVKILNNIILYVICFFCIGIVINLLAVGIFKSPQVNIYILSGIFSFAWIVGFLTPGAPAGLGVRETILVTALEPFYGPGTALGISAFLRIITTSSDALTFVLAITIKKWGFKFSPRHK